MLIHFCLKTYLVNKVKEARNKSKPVLQGVYIEDSNDISGAISSLESLGRATNCWLGVEVAVTAYQGHSEWALGICCFHTFPDHTLCEQ